MSNYDHPKIERIIIRYKKLREKNPERHIEYCLSKSSLKDSIKVAAQAVDGKNKIHDHQYRVGRITLNSFAKKLIYYHNQINCAKSFDDLIEIVGKARIKGIGALTIYDTAQRIGFYLGIYPDKVYLHGGTLIGARYLLGQLPRDQYLLVEELPEPFRRPDIAPWEIEDILCIYKSELKDCIIER